MASHIQYTLEIVPDEKIDKKIKERYPTFVQQFKNKIDNFITSISYTYSLYNATQIIRYPAKKIPMGLACPICQGGYIENGLRYHKPTCTALENVHYKMTDQGFFKLLLDEKKPGPKPESTTADAHIRGQIHINVSIDKDTSFLIAILNEGIINIRLVSDKGIKMIPRALGTIEETFKAVGVDIKYPNVSNFTKYVTLQKNTYEHYRGQSVLIDEIDNNVAISGRYGSILRNKGGITFHLVKSSKEDHRYKITVMISKNTYSIIASKGNVQNIEDRAEGLPSKDTKFIDQFIVNEVNALLLDTILADEHIYTKKIIKNVRGKFRDFPNLYVPPEHYKTSCTKSGYKPPGGIIKLKHHPEPYPYSYSGSCPTGFLLSAKTVNKKENDEGKAFKRYYMDEDQLIKEYEDSTFAYLPYCYVGYSGIQGSVEDGLLGIFSHRSFTTYDELNSAYKNYKNTPKRVNGDPYYPNIQGINEQKWLRYIIDGELDFKKIERNPGKVVSSLGPGRGNIETFAEEVHSQVYRPGWQSVVNGGNDKMILEPPFKGLKNFTSKELIAFNKCLLSQLTLGHRVPFKNAERDSLEFFEIEQMYLNQIYLEIIKKEEGSRCWKGIPKEAVYTKIEVKNGVAYFIDETRNNYNMVDTASEDIIIYGYVHENIIIPVNVRNTKEDYIRRMTNLLTYNIEGYTIRLDVLNIPGMSIEDIVPYADCKTIILTPSEKLYMYYPSMERILIDTLTFQVKYNAKKFEVNEKDRSVYNSNKGLFERKVNDAFPLSKMISILNARKSGSTIYLCTMNYWTLPDGSKHVNLAVSKTIADENGKTSIFKFDSDAIANIKDNRFTPLRQVSKFTESGDLFFNKYCTLMYPLT